MVSTQFIIPESRTRWVHYLMLSLCANALILSVIHMGPMMQPLAMPMLKVNLMSLAAPTIMPQQPKIVEPPQIIKPKMVTHKHAAKTIAKSVEKPTPKKEVAKALSKPLSQLAPSAGGNIGKDKATVIHEAQYRKQTPPAYPRRALELGQQGVVTLHAEILPNGQPRELKVATSSGYRLLDMAAVAAVKKWEFEPKTTNGNRTISWVRVPVNFVIQ